MENSKKLSMDELLSRLYMTFRGGVSWGDTREPVYIKGTWEEIKSRNPGISVLVKIVNYFAIKKQGEREEEKLIGPEALAILRKHLRASLNPNEFIELFELLEGTRSHEFLEEILSYFLALNPTSELLWQLKRTEIAPFVCDELLKRVKDNNIEERLRILHEFRYYGSHYCDSGPNKPLERAEEYEKLLKQYVKKWSNADVVREFSSADPVLDIEKCRVLSKEVERRGITIK